MRTHHTVIHIPVDYDVPEGGNPAGSARFMADMAALEIERLYNQHAPVTVWAARIDNVRENGKDVESETNRVMSALALHEDARDFVRDALQDAYDAGREASLTLNGDRPIWWCLIHGRDACESEPEPYCHGCVEAGVYSAPTGTENAR